MEPLRRSAHATSPVGSSRRAFPAWLLLLANALAFLHLALTPHFIAAGEGHVAHVSPAHELPTDAPCVPDTRTQHDECVVFSALTQAAGFSPIQTVAVHSWVDPIRAPQPTSEAPSPSRRALLRLSPSNSPPYMA